MALKDLFPTVAPKYNIDFVNSGTVDPSIQFTRSSAATYYNKAGTLQSASVNTPRIDYDPVTKQCKGLLVEEQRTNYIRNNTMQGAVLGNPGTLPTNWQTSFISGLSYSVINTGIENGINYIDIRITGTAGATGGSSIQFEANNGVPALINQTWSLSFFHKIINGSISNIAFFAFGYEERTTSWLASHDTTFTPQVNGMLQSSRNSYSAITTNAATTYIKPYIYFNVSSGAVVDFTIRIGMPQLELGAFATSVIPSSLSYTSRASIATYTGSDGLIKTAATNIPRYNYSVSDLTATPQLLLEPTATNLLTYSEQFDNAAWVKNNVSITSNATTAPDGTITADKIIEAATTAQHTSYQAIATTSGTVYTRSVYAKAAEWTSFTLQMGSGGPAGDFNLTNKTTTFSIGATASSIIDVGNGWFRCSVTGPSNGDAAQYIFKTSASYAGDGVSGIYIWGAQLETGSNATSYIPSTDTFTSRASTGSYYGSDGLVKIAATNTARNNYNPTNTSLGSKLLLESTSTNLLTYSEQFDNSIWGKADSSIVANCTKSPDGTINADKLVDNTNNVGHSLYYSANVVSGTIYTFSIYLKAAEYTQATIQFNSNNSVFNQTNAVVDLTTGSIAQKGGTTAPLNMTCVAIGNGWYRASVTSNALISGSGYVAVYTVNASSVGYIGDNKSGVYIWGAQLETGSYPTSYIPSVETFTSRASTATYIGSDGLIKTAAINTVRNTYNPVNVNLGSKMLLEGAATNLLTYSENFTSSNWNQNLSPTVTSNYAISPDGNISASLVTSSANINSGLYRVPTVTSGTTYTYSVYIKNVSNATAIAIGCDANPLAAWITYNAETKQITDATKANVLRSSVIDMGNQWACVSVTFTATSTAPSFIIYSRTGTVSSFLVWGAQVEAGYSATSYIPTTNTQVTRAADISTSANGTRAADVSSSVAGVRAADVYTLSQATRAADVPKLSGSAFTNWYRQDEGTFVFEGDLLATTGGGTPILYSTSSGAFANSLYVVKNGVNDYVSYSVINGTNQGSIRSSNTVSANTPFIAASAYKVNNFGMGTRNGIVNLDTSGQAPSNQKSLTFGNGDWTGTSNQLSGHIRRLSYYNTRVSDTQLQYLSK